jgi:hypothetical protein
MKPVKLALWSLSGLLAVLALAGCVSPISPPLTALEPERDSGSNAVDWRAPFTLTLHINADGSARVAGLAENTITGICNYAQLVIAQDGNIVAFADRQIEADQENAPLSVTITPKKTYDILVLMGHWEHTNEDVLPTLLGAGLQSQLITAGENAVTIQMNPLVVDTKFTRSAETITTAHNGVSTLTPGDWNLEWTITPGVSETNGFTGLLAAQESILGRMDESVLFRDTAAVMVKGGTRWKASDIEVSENVVALNLGELAAEATGSYNFNLEYVPFSVNESAKWSEFSATNKKDGLPVWIIRNGINDWTQNADTDLSAPADWGGAKNGNGAVGFKVLEPEVG